METFKKIDSDQVFYNTNPRDPKISVPQIQSLKKSAEILLLVDEQQEKTAVQTLTVDYRPDDFAVVWADVCKDVLGVTLQNGTGFRPAETKRVKTSLTTTREVPWGPNLIPAWEDAQMEVGYTMHPEKGALGQVKILVKNKYNAEVKELFRIAEAAMAVNSIYMGKAIVGTHYPEFYDLGKFRPELVTHSDLVRQSLEVFLFSRLQNLKNGKLEELGESFGCKVLLHGPYGTGKTSTALQAATIAARYGIGFIHARPGQDDIYDTLRTAKLYSRDGIIVLLEDADIWASNKTSDRELMRLLEALDGATSKSNKVIIIMTTNHRDRIHPGMFRPGRTDLEVEINQLDRAGVEHLIRAHVQPLLGDVDFDRVYSETVVNGEDTFTGSHVESMVRHVRMAGLYRTNETDFKLSTEDFIRAAAPVKLQQKLQAEAKEGPKPPAIEASIQKVVTETVKGLLTADDEVSSSLFLAADRANDSQNGPIGSMVRDIVQEAIDSTVLMDRNKDSVKGALDVQ